jgi:hypothetical protein
MGSPHTASPQNSAGERCRGAFARETISFRPEQELPRRAVEEAGLLVDQAAT